MRCQPKTIQIENGGTDGLSHTDEKTVSTKLLYGFIIVNYAEYLQTRPKMVTKFLIVSILPRGL